MIDQTQITFTLSEINAILILAKERAEAEEAGAVKHVFDTAKTIWLRDCKAIISKTDKAFTHCICAEDAQTPRPYHYELD